MLAAEALFSEQTSRRRLKLLVGSLDLVDVNLLLLVHLRKPLVHELLLRAWHRSE